MFFVIVRQHDLEVLNISSKELQINEEIRDKEVRVIDSNGEQLGIMKLEEALDRAAASNLDLVKIAPQAQPPVCKIIDYGKFRFEQAKREKEAKKNQRVVDIKEIRLSLNIDTHDFNTKAGHAARFLKDGDKVKVSIRFRGREMGHPELGYEIMQKFAAVSYTHLLCGFLPCWSNRRETSSSSGKRCCYSVPTSVPFTAFAAAL